MNLASGFWPVKGVHGQSVIEANRRQVASSYATGIFMGDPVAASTDATYLAAGTSTLVSGVSNGASYVLSGKRISDKFLPASTTYSPTALGSANGSFIFAFEDPGAVYSAGFSAALTSDYYTYAGLNANCAGSPTGSTTTGISGYVLDAATLAAGTFQFRIVMLDDATADEDVSTANVKGYVQIQAPVAGASPYLTSTGL